jgi:hypothetical protein
VIAGRVAPALVFSSFCLLAVTQNKTPANDKTVEVSWLFLLRMQH